MTENITVTITTPSDREAVVTREFNAPAALVFEAVTIGRSDQALVWPGRIPGFMRERGSRWWIVALRVYGRRQADG